MLYVAGKRGLPWKCARFVLFHPFKKCSFNLLCVLDFFQKACSQLFFQIFFFFFFKIIVFSTGQHSTTWWSDQNLVDRREAELGGQPEMLCRMGPRTLDLEESHWVPSLLWSKFSWLTLGPLFLDTDSTQPRTFPASAAQFQFDPYLQSWIKNFFFFFTLKNFFFFFFSHCDYSLQYLTLSCF